MKKIHCSIFCLIILALVSCKKKDSCGADTWHYNITGDSVLVAGDTINLKATNVPNAAFSWTGPNNFTSTNQAISIPADNSSVAGTYTVKYSSADGCINHNQSITVKVGAPTPPCTLTANWINYAGISESMGGYYSNNTITGNSNDADIVITFAGTPVTGVYNVVDISNLGYDLQSNQVTISLTAFNYYGGQAGSLIYVNAENGQITASFCSIIFDQFACTASITCSL